MGLSKDEFTDNSGWPRRLYIRSARRMVSGYVITEHHTRRKILQLLTTLWPLPGGHPIHIMRGGLSKTGLLTMKDLYLAEMTGVLSISWRALIPRRSECTNLITPTCPSSSYVAYGAIRILPTFMILGQSAGSAAAMIVDENIPVQELDYSLLRERLLDDGQILVIPPDWLRYVMSEGEFWCDFVIFDL
ncbi:MAG: FAD-dependent oxidoreductase [Bacteroidia bacterium]